HCRHCRLNLGGVAQIVVTDGAQLLVQFVDQRLAGRNVQVHDIVVRDVVQVLDQRTQAVAVGGDEHTTPGTNGRGNGFVPERQNALHRVLETLGGRQQSGIDLGVAAIEARVAFVVVL